ncbi:MAG: hypothetical protein M1816_000578 [Peltula sp. TS41687]|nr:MAG: hypothetical protein M1816_000578 [Peltula sp. TS41687]
MENMNEKQEAPINGAQQLDGEEPERPLMADDYEAMKRHVLKEIPDLETESEVISTWNIEGWRHLPRRTHGTKFYCGGHPWRVLAFPFGNNVEYASFYLEQAYDEKPKEDWYACVQFALVMWNIHDPSIFLHHTANHRFTVEEGDWGFTRFAELRKLFNVKWEDRDRTMVDRGCVNVTAYVRIVKDPTGVLWHNFVNYDSKKETGYVGLRNQGATCYLNSLLQSLYFTNAFRKAIYQIPTQNEEKLTNSAYTLQRLFYLLQTTHDAVPTAELTRSFGWDSRQIFEQQDVQELSRILMERMEEKMKGTEAENALAKLFVGKTKTYISCIKVDFESSRVEDFWDIQLNVRGNKTLDESFKDYIQVETMEGDNKYYAEGYGLQEAKKGVIFESFPQVLHLQLKRFEYDVSREAMMKVNDRYEFPEEFDAAPYLSEDADKSEPWIYQLHGVLVHSGDFNAGHYYAFLKPTKDGHFYKFDDDRVTRATMKEVLDENFGGDYDIPNGHVGVRNPYTRTLSTKRSMSAYMLVYIRQSRLDNVLIDVTTEDTPPHIEKRLEDERALREQRKKERDEQHLYLTLQVISDETFKHYQGLDLAVWDSDPNHDPAAPRIYRIRKSTTITELCAMIAEDLGQKADHVRLWVMVNRENKTTRPDQPLVHPNATIEDEYIRHAAKPTGFRLYAETAQEVDDDGRPVWRDAQHQTLKATHTLLFLKHFDVEAQTVRGVGHVHFSKTEKISELTAPILQAMNWPLDTNLKLYEEIKPAMIEPMKPGQTLVAAEIQDGDIVCFQKAIPEKDLSSVVPPDGIADVRDFYDNLCHRVTVRFAPKTSQPRPDEIFELGLNRRMLYDQFSAKVGQHLGVAPTHIRFWTINATTNNPKAVVRRTPTINLHQILTPSYGNYAASSQLSNALYYEVLDLSLTELESKKSLKVIWLSEGISKEDTIDVLAPKNGVISDVLAVLKNKVNLQDCPMEHIRLYEVHANKIYKILHPDLSVASINDYVTLYAEKIPEDELQAEDKTKFINAFHFNKDPSKAHGVPFRFILKQGETFKQTKERLEKRTGLKGKLFEKIRFALVPRVTYTKPSYLNDEDDELYEALSEGEFLLGLDHVDRSKTLASGRADGIIIR